MRDPTADEVVLGYQRDELLSFLRYLASRCVTRAAFLSVLAVGQPGSCLQFPGHLKTLGLGHGHLDEHSCKSVGYAGILWFHLIGYDRLIDYIGQYGLTLSY